MRPLTYEERSIYACDICGNVPDEDGTLEHGKGCYVVSEDGGGTTFVEFPCKHERLNEEGWCRSCGADCRGGGS